MNTLTLLADSLISTAYARNKIPLSGKWKAVVDPYGCGVERQMWRNLSQASTHTPVEYDFDAADTINIPGDWNSQDKQYLFYEGAFWFRKTFDYTLAKGKRLFLYIGAANYITHVTVNGTRLGIHEGGFTPFNVEITGLVRPKANFIVLMVDSTRRKEGVPSTVTDWWNYGGITREPYLIETPGAFIQDLTLQLKKGSQDILSAEVRVNGGKRGTRICIALPGTDVWMEARTDASGRAHVEKRVAVELWSPEKPKLYAVEATCGKDVVRDRIGFRSITAQGTKILLNGNPVFLRGVCLHEESFGNPCRAYSRAQSRKLLLAVKELGCNFVRLAHYPHNEHMVRLADEMGLLVWSELPAYWGISWKNPFTYATAQNQFDEMIRRDRNRAAIILWSIANETPPSPERNSFLKRLAAFVRKSDPTRLISAALQSIRGKNPILISDPLGKVLDVVGFNEYIGWYDGVPHARLDGLRWAMEFNKPLIMSEFGAEALAGLHGKKSKIWTEEYQSDFYKHQLKMLEKIPFLAGTCPWILKDFFCPRRLRSGVQDLYNRKGLMSERGEKKKAFFIMADWYCKWARQVKITD